MKHTNTTKKHTYNKQDIQLNRAWLNKLRTNKNKIPVPNNIKELGYDGNLKTKTKFRTKNKILRSKQTNEQQKSVGPKSEHQKLSFKLPTHAKLEN